MLLNEMVIMLGVIGLVMLIAGGMLHTLVRRVPRDLHDFNEYTTLGDLLAHMEGDIRSARTLPTSALGMDAALDVLPLETPDGPVVYARRPGSVVRYVIDPNGVGQPVEQAAWPLPDCVVEWHVRYLPADFEAMAAERVSDLLPDPNAPDSDDTGGAALGDGQSPTADGVASDVGRVPNAVEIHTRLERHWAGEQGTYFRNTHIFFIRSRPDDPVARPSEDLP